MSQPASAERRHTVESYFGLVDQGVLGPDDRLELLEGVIVATSQSPRAASVTTRNHRALQRALGERDVIRVQQPLVVGPSSVPEPDVAVASGDAESDYDDAHPSAALPVVEVADTSLLQDRLTKGPLYASGGIPELWIVDLRSSVLEVFRNPSVPDRRYDETLRTGRQGSVKPVRFPDARIAVADFLP